MDRAREGRTPRAVVGARHIGRRGEFLLFLTLLDFLYGLSLLRPAPQRSAPPRPGS
jgi:hypothetical protein